MIQRRKLQFAQMGREAESSDSGVGGITLLTSASRKSLMASVGEWRLVLKDTYSNPFFERIAQ